MENEELNKKLAEWAGFRIYAIGGASSWIKPTGGIEVKLPKFTESLDACFKWLVPKLPYIFVFDYAEGGWACFARGCEGAPDKAVGEAETPALALCKAIEQLIDKEVVNET